MSRISLYALVMVMTLVGVPLARAEDTSLSTQEYQNVPVGLLAAPLTQDQPTESKQALPDALGQIPGVYAIPGAPNQEKKVEALTFDQIQQLYRDKKYEPLLKDLRALANGGTHEAEELLGVMYMNGQGVPKDPAQGFNWISRAAQGNRTTAQHYLGVMYMTGDGTGEVDPTQALMWIQIAILHYPDGPEKTRAKQDRDSIYVKMSRLEKTRALQMARDWLEAKGEGHLIDSEE